MNHDFIPSPRLTMEDAVNCFLLDWLDKVQEIGGERPAAFDVHVDNYHPDGPRVRYSAYIKGVPGTAAEFPTARDAFEALADRASYLQVTARVAALRAEADELERGAQ